MCQSNLRQKIASQLLCKCCFVARFLTRVCISEQKTRVKNPCHKMDVHKIHIKFFASEPVQVEQAEFVPVFHSWIQIQSVPDHTLIDVADYAHVKDGPGILLVANEANFYADWIGGRFGLTYQRKHPAPGDFKDRLRQ